MRLTLKIKLLPTEDQGKLLLETIKLANATCNIISDIAWKNKAFNQIKLHHLCYHDIKPISSLSSQIIVRCISKVSDSYKLDKKIKRVFSATGGIAYDSRILTYKPQSIISIWCIGGRQKMPYVCHNKRYLPYIKGEADLIYKKGKFFLMQSVEVPDSEVGDVEEFIGVDFGVTDIAVTSDGVIHSSEWLTNYRDKRQKIRSSIQSKGTKGAKKLLKRLSGKEKTTGYIINHTISKSIVTSAIEQNRGIAIEDLSGIRGTSSRRNKKFRTKLGRWSFYQLRNFIEYKSKKEGVKLVVVHPRYTSKTCSICFHIGDRKNKNFKCNNCGVNIDADFNASRNIALLGAAINKPEKSDMFSCAIHNLV